MRITLAYGYRNLEICRQYKEIKMVAFYKSQSLKQLFLDAIENIEKNSYKNKEHLFNEEIETAFKESRAGKKLKNIKI